MICASQLSVQTTNVAYMAGTSHQTRTLRTRKNSSWLAEKPRVPAYLEDAYVYILLTLLLT